MSVETALYPPQLNTNWPRPDDMVSEGDDHIRLTKTVIKTTFPNVAGVIHASQIELNYMTGVTAPLQGQFDSKGNIAGQTWTGAHVFPATTTVGAVTPTIFGYLGGITGDVQAQIDSKGAKAGQAWTGAQDFTGATITAATQGAGDSSTNVATTAFVAAAAFDSALPGQAGNARKRITTDGASASWTWPGLEAVVHTSSATMTRGVLNVAATAGITLTVPSTLSANETVAMMNATGTLVYVAFNGHKVKNVTPDEPMSIPAYRGFETVYTGTYLA